MSSNGTLPIQRLKQLIREGGIKASVPVQDKQLQPASMDLRLGNKAYRVRSSFLPQHRRVDELLKDLFMYEIDLDEIGILATKNARNAAGVIELRNMAALHWEANPKSTT